jgi:diaminohydroxyphosphoribosylaminopyrimidine deaminase / 5-amino-6-(5-phosphoribosylamino)uracil reductase
MHAPRPFSALWSRLSLWPHPTGDLDDALMVEALRQADRALGRTAPNPPVGAALRTLDGAIFAGHTQPVGHAHAEVMAINAALKAGATLRGATMATTLEPCSHHGRTPPCADRIVAEGIARVVVGTTDPNPLVNGQGVARLRAAGVGVADASPGLAMRCEALSRAFVTRLLHQRCYLIWKVATSLDGRVALSDGTSKYLTGPAARSLVHHARDACDAVVVGSMTAKLDNPELTVRHAQPKDDRQPRRYVIDPQRRVPSTHHVIRGGTRLVVDRAHAGEHQVAADGNRVSLNAMARALAAQGHQLLMVESGPSLGGALLAQGLVDEVWWFRAPLWLGADAVPALPALAVADLAAPRPLTLHQLDVEDDHLWVGRPPAQNP